MRRVLDATLQRLCLTPGPFVSVQHRLAWPYTRPGAPHIRTQGAWPMIVLACIGAFYVVLIITSAITWFFYRLTEKQNDL